MSDDVVKKDENKQVMTKEEVDEALIIQYMDTFGIADKLTPAQKRQFIAIAKAFKLNPFKREIYPIPYGGKLELVVGAEVYRKRAETSGLLDGIQYKIEKVPGMGDQAADWKCVTTIYRKDWKHPYVSEAFLSEHRKETPIWRTMPKVMLRKCGIAAALRMCFPEECAGLPYEAAEILDNPVLEGELNVGLEAVKEKDPDIQEVIPKDILLQKGDLNKAIKVFEKAKTMEELVELQSKLDQRSWTEDEIKFLQNLIKQSEERVRSLAAEEKKDEAK